MISPRSKYILKVRGISNFEIRSSPIRVRPRLDLKKLRLAINFRLMVSSLSDSFLSAATPGLSSSSSSGSDLQLGFCGRAPMASKIRVWIPSLLLRFFSKKGHWMHRSGSAPFITRRYSNLGSLSGWANTESRGVDPENWIIRSTIPLICSLQDTQIGGRKSFCIWLVFWLILLV